MDENNQRLLGPAPSPKLSFWLKEKSPEKPNEAWASENETNSSPAAAATAQTFLSWSKPQNDLDLATSLKAVETSCPSQCS